MTENKSIGKMALPPSVTEVLTQAVAEEIQDLAEDARLARERGDVPALVALVEAIARIKLDVAATAIRIEANIRQMVLSSRLPSGVVEKAAGALAKLRGASAAAPADEGAR
jgi:hypothetical protein